MRLPTKVTTRIITAESRSTAKARSTCQDPTAIQLQAFW